MKGAAACTVLTLTAALSGLKLQAQTLPQELRPVVPAATLLGQAKMTFWGFEVYQATLWVAPGFTESSYEQSAFALELAYLRELRGRDIAERSITEMRRQAPMSPTQEAAWEGQMRALFPDVKAGDRITGVGGEEVTEVAQLWRLVWASGAPGVQVKLQLQRDDSVMTVRVTTSERTRFLKTPRMH